MRNRRLEETVTIILSIVLCKPGYDGDSSHPMRMSTGSTMRILVQLKIHDPQPQAAMTRSAI